jgi:hypothetical protein
MVPVNRSKIPWWPLAVAAAAAGVLVYAAIPSSAPAPSTLKGSWVRDDGDYRLQVDEAREDGTASVKYFNPNPIRVGDARTAAEAGKRLLRVELRDENYPGSIYTLAYDPKGDRLEGEYFQATQRQTFPVSFRRKP